MSNWGTRAYWGLNILLIGGAILAVLGGVALVIAAIGNT